MVCRKPKGEDSSPDARATTTRSFVIFFFSPLEKSPKKA